jgi:hypothetical protein
LDSELVLEMETGKLMKRAVLLKGCPRFILESIKYYSHKVVHRKSLKRSEL